MSHGLLLHRNSSNELQAYSDADWARCPDDRRSTGAYCVFLCSSLVSWSSQKKPTVSRSSTEADIRLLQISHPNFYGSGHYFKNLEFVSLLHQLFGLIILAPTTCLSIRCSMHVPSMWKLTSTLFEIALQISPWWFALLLARISLQMLFLLNLLFPPNFNNYVSSSTCNLPR
jgi:hypothetical protein